MATLVGMHRAAERADEFLDLAVFRERLMWKAIGNNRQVSGERLIGQSDQQIERPVLDGSEPTDAHHRPVEHIPHSVSRCYDLVLAHSFPCEVVPHYLGGQVPCIIAVEKPSRDRSSYRPHAAA